MADTGHGSFSTASTSASTTTGRQPHLPGTNINNPKKSRRRFPGPAGLLPLLKPDEFHQLDKRNKNPISKRIDAIISDTHQNNENKTYTDNIPLSQIQLLSSQEDSVFEGSVYLTLLQELGLNSKDPDPDPDSFLNIMNIQWVLKKATKLPSYTNIPFLVAVLQESDDLLANSSRIDSKPHIKLVDPTGQIEAAVHPNLLSLYGDAFVSGTAIALKNVGTLESRRDLILTITESNVICMTCRKEVEEPPKPSKQPRKLRDFVTDSDIRVLYLSEFDTAKLLQDYHAMSLPNPNAELQISDDEEENVPDESLFTECSTLGGYKNQAQFVPPRKSNVGTSYSEPVHRPKQTPFVPPQRSFSLPVSTEPFEVDDDDGDDLFVRALDEAESQLSKSSPERMDSQNVSIPSDAAQSNSNDVGEEEFEDEDEFFNIIQSLG